MLVWRIKQNYLGLLNLPATIKEMGPLRMLSELDYKEEASIKYIKKQMHNGQTGKNWAYNAMVGYYRDKSNKYILKDCVRDAGRELGTDDEASYMLQVASKYSGEPLPNLGVPDLTDEDPPTYATTSKEYVTFGDQNCAIESLGASDVVSGVVMNNRLYLIIKSNNTKTAVEIKPARHQKKVCGADYFSYEMVTTCTNDDMNEASEYFLLLPLLNSNGVMTKGSFYLITSGWREVTHQKENDWALQLATFPGATY